MIYKIILSKTEVIIDEEDKQKITSNIDKNFIILKSGEVINPSFVQGIVIDHEASRQEIKELKMKENMGLISAPEISEPGNQKSIKEFRPAFMDEM